MVDDVNDVKFHFCHPKNLSHQAHHKHAANKSFFFSFPPTFLIVSAHSFLVDPPILWTTIAYQFKFFDYFNLKAVIWLFMSCVQNIKITAHKLPKRFQERAKKDSGWVHNHFGTQPEGGHWRWWFKLVIWGQCLHRLGLPVSRAGQTWAPWGILVLWEGDMLRTLDGDYPGIAISGFHLVNKHWI